MQAPNCCHVSFAFLLKLFNFLQAFVGVSIILYSLWMLDRWSHHHVPVSPPPTAPSPVSDSASSLSHSLLLLHRPLMIGIEDQPPRLLDDFALSLSHFRFSSVNLPAPWFIYSFMGVGIVLCCITFIGCIAAESINGCCLCFYTLLKIVLILIEAAFVAFIAFDHRWEKDLPFDATGELEILRSFIEDNIDVCKWVGISVVIIQALSLLVAIILRAMVSTRRRAIDNEDDYENIRGRTWEPLLNPQSSHAATSAKGDGRGTHSDIWGSRIREKYGLNIGERHNSGDKYNLLNQDASASMRSK